MNDKRIILDTPFIHRNIISYGLIVYAKKTKKLLLVQRKHSAEFILIIKGSIRISYLPFLLVFITDNEKEMLFDAIESDEIYNYIYNEVLQIDKKWINQSYIMFNSYKKYIYNILNKINTTDNILKWEFPKGQRLNYSENPYQCALREFKEETEIDLPNPLLISDNTIHDIKKTITGIKLELKYWIYIIDDEVKLNKITNNEISNIGWFSLKDTHQLIKNDEIFNNIEIILNRNKNNL